MPIKKVRRLVKLGASTTVISLPKGWLNFYRLKPGDWLEVETNGNGDLRMRPLRRKKIKIKEDKQKKLLQ